MINIILPTRFEHLLKINQWLDGIVKKTLADFGEILADNKLYFFGEYTDHGIKHIESVLASSDSIITEATFNESLTVNDVAYYILAVILHDIGMHINMDGFELLINGEFDRVRIPKFDTKTWKQLWEEFVDHSKKLNGKQLKAIFGDENTIVRSPPFLKRGEINENDKKLIGEFIRINHSRLAHEIALIGFPGRHSNLVFADGIQDDVKDLIGIIARSHGIDLRKSVDYLEFKFGKSSRRHPFNTHATYLMTLLRISDYLQIDATRTSSTLIKIKSFSSPISELEHNAHLAIDYIDNKYQEDPERIYVKASPTDSVMYLKLKKLVRDIQFEFDMSWAILGEVYGQFSYKLEIKFRRITSNLEDIDFVNKQSYLADNFYFKANDEITKLLIAPLYGDDPKFGVRELLQNAIDACKEREEIEIKAGNLAYSPQIYISIENKADPVFVIFDNGIGMDANIIKNYFLNAGASYRKSLEWQKEFLDAKGNTIIRRSGRFGVGILAAFLIGFQIDVETSRLGQAIGFKFSANLQSDQINVIKDESLEAGTRITIKINEEVKERFRPNNRDYYVRNLQWFQWFTLANPTIEYTYLNEKLTTYKNLDPDINNIPIEWNSIDYPGFNKILWTYANNYAEPSFACNGIVIPHENFNRDVLDLGLVIRNPKISIFDNNAFTPISLDRNSFSSNLPFEKELMIDIFKDYISYLLTFKNISYADENSVRLINNELDYPGFSSMYYYSFTFGSNNYDFDTNLNKGLKQMLDRLLVSKEGFIVDYNFFLNRIKNRNIIFIQSTDFAIGDKPFKLDLKHRYLSFTTSKLNSIPDYISAIEGRNYDYSRQYANSNDVNIYIKSSKFNFLFDPNKKRVSRWLQDKVKNKFESDGWTHFTIDNPKETCISGQFLKTNKDRINFIREYELGKLSEGDEILNGLLKKYIGDDVVIPYELEKRKLKFSLAFVELNRYMQKYLKQKK
jgi:molecular chaperone HtpG